ncbi:Do family serine endopeptidase [Malaciobacter marinus]|uniref:Serine protease n=1 Tax=Malaciobacter marinus TaxID=505249 RepID=A0A347TNW5_9BACT|nr:MULTISPECIES: Do family serine endopeptidase [Malaciobacter]AXX88293.1 periplasmic heat shock serine protease HtrA, Do family [Malaciobacter marinus]PHO11746.1 serine protease [Malaciobacter marinus]PHO14624.1 serine protease [Malaciobacter marinus]RYA23259.1 PDZ domain-containing protein [Malaciobacter halophilus]
MKSKLFIISTLIATNIFANSIDFNMAQKDTKRVSPTSSTELLSFNSSVKDAMKSVVNISAKRHVNAMENFPLQMFNDPIFKRFFGDQFGNQFQQSRIQRSLGSGVILSKDGYVVTNNHVIENAEEIIVTIGDDPTEYNAKVIGKDADSDVAVIKIEGNNFQPIKIGYSNNLKIGDIIFALGNPFGIGSTVTQGIISALNKNKVGINRYENFIQTDASINPGNSGGALIDSRGALIGINSAIISKGGGNDGIGFAIPVAMVKDVVEKLIKDGKVTRGYLGVVIGDLDKKLTRIYNHKKGALILDISPDTPAEKYGLKRGDLIYSIDKKSVKDRADLQNIIASFKPNQKITLQIERDKKNYTFNIVLGNRDGLIVSTANNGKFLGGLRLAELDTNMMAKFRINRNIKGVLITEVEPKSRAEKVGFQPGDVIVQIEDMEIESFVNMQQAIRKYNNKHKRVYVNRYGQTILLVIK